MVLGPRSFSASMLHGELSQLLLGLLPDRKLTTSWGRLARLVRKYPPPDSLSRSLLEMGPSAAALLRDLTDR